MSDISGINAGGWIVTIVFLLGLGAYTWWKGRTEGPPGEEE